MAKVTLLGHTPEPEKIVAAAAKLCYSSQTVEGLMDGLTPEKTDSFIKMLADLGHNEKKTVLIVMHDINTAIKYADRIAVMDDGQLVFCGDTRTCIECGVIEKVFGVRKTTESDNPFFSI